jgi:hypothetical protein
MRQIRTTLPAVVALILGFANPAPAQDGGPRGFSGEYVMEGWGLDPRGIGYRGSCSVLGDGPAYRVSCINNDTRHTYVGKGLALGETLSIFVGDELAGDDPGLFSGEYLVVYRRQSNGVLEGTWLHAWSGTAGVETLTPRQ